MECLLWLSEPCCLCTSDTLQEGRWVCPYSEAPAQSPRTLSSARRRMAREAALRGQGGRTDEEEWTECNSKEGYYVVRFQNKGQRGQTVTELKRFLVLVRFLMWWTVPCRARVSICTYTRVSHHTQDVEGHRGLSEIDVVLASSHLATIFPRVLLGNSVYGQRGSVYLCPSRISLCTPTDRWSDGRGWTSPGVIIEQIGGSKNITHWEICHWSTQTSRPSLSSSTQYVGSDPSLSWTHRRAQRLEQQENNI